MNPSVGRSTASVLLLAVFAMVGCSAAPPTEGKGPSSTPLPRDATPEPAASGAAPAAAPAQAEENETNVCEEVSRRAAECNIERIPSTAVGDLEKGKADMKAAYVKECTERTADEPDHLESVRACLDEADDCALVECLGDTIGH